MPGTNIERLLGSLEAGLLALSHKTDMILASQSEQRRESLQAIEKLEKEQSEARARIYERIEREKGFHEQAFKASNEVLVKLSDHMVRFETTADSVESHGDALVDIEKRTNKAEEIIKNLVNSSGIQTEILQGLSNRMAECDKVVHSRVTDMEKAIQSRVTSLEEINRDRVRAARQNKVWVKTIMSILAFLEAAHLGGGKLLKWLEPLFK